MNCLNSLLQKSHSFIFCLDGGGTKTALHILDKNLDVISECVFGGTNLNTRSYAAITQEMKETIAAISLEGVPFSDFVGDSLFLGGFAGAKSKRNKEALYELAKSLGFAPKKTLIMGDAEFALKLIVEQGLILIAGTGSVCLGKNGPKISQAGGLGPKRGDEGSAYRIGKLGIEAGLASVQDPRPSSIANLAPKTFEKSDEGNELAAGIINKSAKALGHLIEDVMNKLQLDEAYIYCIGGVFKNKRADAFIKKIEDSVDRRPNFINLADYDIVCLAVRECFRRMSTEGICQEDALPIPPATFRKSFSENLNYGEISTEQTHPLTKNLDKVLKKDIVEGLKLLHQVDIESFHALRDNYMDKAKELDRKLKDVLDNGGRLFLCGAGSSGRIAYSLAAKMGKSVVPLMAGGPTAFVRPVEGLEDLFDLGKNDLAKRRPNARDLIVLISASGAAKYNFGVASAAKERGVPVLLFCNSKTMAKDTEQAVKDWEIEVFSFDTSPQAITGSTRLQAANAALLILGTIFSGEAFEEVFKAYKNLLKETSRQFEKLKKLIEEAYHALELRTITYLGDENSLRALMMDSSEMPPTFSLNPPKRRKDRSGPPTEFRAYLKEESDNRKAWEKLLSREIDEDDWNDCDEIIIGGKVKDASSLEERILDGSFTLEFSVEKNLIRIASARGKPLEIARPPGILTELLLKHICNYLSNAVMALKGKVWGNVMVDLSPSNHKLIDRGVRIVKEMHKGVLPNDKILREYLIRACYQKKCKPSTPSPVRQVLAIAKTIKK